MTSVSILNLDKTIQLNKIKEELSLLFRIKKLTFLLDQSL